MMTFNAALIIALWIAIVESRITGYASLMLRFSPLMTGLVCGIVMGEIEQAVIISAHIQLVYYGAVATGGSLSSEPAVAAAVTVPVALLSRMTPFQSIVLALPAGVTGHYIYRFRIHLYTLYTKEIERIVLKLNERKTLFYIVILPLIISITLFTVTIFSIIFFIVPNIVELLDTVLKNKLFSEIIEIVGVLLSMLGISIGLQVTGKKNFFIFFILGYLAAFLINDFKVGNFIHIILGVILTEVYLFFKFDKNQGE